MLTAQALENRFSELTDYQANLVGRSIRAIQGSRYLPSAKRAALAFKAFKMMSGAETPAHVKALIAELVAWDFKA